LTLIFGRSRICRTYLIFITSALVVAAEKYNGAVIKDAQCVVALAKQTYVCAGVWIGKGE